MMSENNKNVEDTDDNDCFDILLGNRCRQQP